jgi:hypothetical protein
MYLLNHENKVCVDFLKYLLNSFNPFDKAEKIIKEGLTVKYLNLETMNLEELKGNFFSLSNESEVFKAKAFKSKGLLILTQTKLLSLEEKFILNQKFIFNKSISDFSVYFFKNNMESPLRTNKSVKPKSSKHLKSTESEINNNDLSSKTDYLKTEYGELEKSQKEKMIKKILKNKSLYDINSNQLLSIVKNSNKLINSTCRKKFDMMVYLDNNFPLKLQFLNPILYILSLLSNEFSTISNVISSQLLPFNTVPLKIIFPAGMSFDGMISVDNYSNELISESVFEVCFDDHANSCTNQSQMTVNQIISNKVNTSNSNTPKMSAKKKSGLILDIDLINNDKNLNSLFKSKNSQNLDEQNLYSDKELELFKSQLFFNSEEMSNDQSSDNILNALLLGKLYKDI